MSKTEKKINLEQKEIKTSKRNKRKKTILKIFRYVLLFVFLFTVITTVISIIGLKSNIKTTQDFSNVGSRQLKLENP